MHGVRERLNRLGRLAPRVGRAVVRGTGGALPRRRRRPVGVVVLAMGRSGTSAFTRVTNLLGVPLGSEPDLLAPNEGNEAGYWESAALLRFQDEMLARHGGSWYAPPALPPSWDREGEEAVEARRVFASVYGDAEAWLWKDPRCASLFPFWATVLDARLVIVLPHRSPHAVAESLRARDGLDPAFGLALWERYNRLVLAHARGRPTFVASYEELVEHPVEVASELRDFLAAERVPVVDEVPADAIRSFIDPALWHARQAAAEDDGTLSTAQRSLLRTLHALRGARHRLGDVILPPETPSTEQLIAQWRAEHGTGGPPPPAA